MTVEIRVFIDVIEVDGNRWCNIFGLPPACASFGLLLQCKFRLNRQFLSI